MLKKSGYDAIIIKGKSKTPVYLVIQEGVPSLHSAQNLWGKTVGQTQDWLDEQHHESCSAVIGPAGENMVRFANIISGRSHQASRGGMGAVMGSKNLKAVVLSKGSLPESAKPEALAARYSWFDKKMRNNALSMWQYNFPGFGVGLS